MLDLPNLNIEIIPQLIASHIRVREIAFDRVCEHIPQNRIRPLISRTFELIDYRALMFQKVITKLTEVYKVLQSQPR